MGLSATATITVSGLSRSLSAALQQRADKLGLTAEDYVKELIAEDFRLNKTAASKSLIELAKPIEMALAGLSERELDALAKPKKKKAGA